MVLPPSLDLKLFKLPDAVQRAPLLAGVRAVPDDLRAGVLNVVESVHDLLVAVDRLLQVQVIHAGRTHHRQLLARRPLPVRDRLRELHALQLLLLSHVEHLQNAARSLALRLQRDDILTRVHQHAISLVRLPRIPELQ